MSRRGTKNQLPDPAIRMRKRAETAKARSRRLGRRAGLLACAAVGITAVGLYVFARHHAGPTPPTPVSAADSNTRACILSTSDDPSLGVARTGLQQAASKLKDVNVQSFSLPSNATDAAPYLQGLINDKCRLILTIGYEAGSAAYAYARNNPETPVKFIAVGNAPQAPTSVKQIAPSHVSSTSIANMAMSSLS